MGVAPMLLVGMLVLAGCGGSSAAPTVQGGAATRFPMTVETCGREVTIERQPEQVMTVGAEAPTLMWAAGAADKIKVRAATFGDTYDPAEAAFKDAPLISANDEPTKEVILGQEPDLLLTYGLTITPWEEAERLGIDQIVVSGQCDSAVDDGPRLDREASFQNIYDDIELYGRIFGTEDIAAKAVADLRERVAAVEKRFRDAPKRTAAVLAAYPGQISVYGLPSISHVQLKTLGLTNAFADITDKRYVELNSEDLLARDPDVLLLANQVTAEEAMQQLRAIPGAERLTAIREGHIIPIEGGQAVIGGIQTIEALEDMADTLAGFR